MACSITRIPKIGPNKGKRVESELFNKILELQPDSFLAEQVYRDFYSIDFIDKFGDWVGSPEMLGDRVTENGEPKLLIEEGKAVLKDKDNNSFEIIPDMQLEDLPGENTKKSKPGDNLKITQKGMQMIMEKLSKRMGLSYKIINDMNKKWAGKFVAGTAVVNVAYARRDTPFHEFAHPFVDHIYNVNRKFFESLYNDAIKSSEGVRAMSQLKDSQPDLQGEDFRKELVVQLLGEYAADNITPSGRQNLKLIERISELVKKFGEAFRKIIKNKRLQAENLHNLKLKELAVIFAAGDNEIATELSDFTKDRTRVAVNGLAAKLVNDGVIYEFEGNFFVNDGGIGRIDPTEENLQTLRQLEESYPGMLYIENNNSIFKYGAGRYIVSFPKTFDVVEAKTNAQYQIIAANQEDTGAKIDTIGLLRNIIKGNNNRLSSDGKMYEGKGGAYERLTSFTKKITGRNMDKEAALSAAEGMFKYKDKEKDTIKINDKDLTFDETVKHFEKNFNYGRAFGKAAHKIIERYITGDKRLDKELADIKRKKEDQEEIPSASLNWVEDNAAFFTKLAGYVEGDTMVSELMLHSDILGIATQIDGLIQKENGNLIMVDWKTGRAFLNTTNRVLKWAEASNVQMNNSKQTAAQIELILRAMMIKEHVPDAKFEAILLHHIQKFNTGKLPKNVDVRNVLRVLESYFKAESPDVYQKLKAKNLFDYRNYMGDAAVGSSTDVISRYADLDPKLKQKRLEEDLQANRFRLENDRLSQEQRLQIKQENEILLKTILELRSFNKESIEGDEQVGNVKRMVSSLWNIDNKKIQAFTSMYQEQRNRVLEDVFKDKQIAQQLFKDVKDEYDAKNPINKAFERFTAGLRSKMDYRDLYSFAYTYKDNDGYVPGFYKKSKEEYTAEYKAGKITKAQFNLLEYLDKTWSESFDQAMNRVAYVNDRGRDVTYLQALQIRGNLEGVTKDNQLDSRFLPRFQKENNEYLEDYRGLDRLTKGTWARFKSFMAKQLTFFYEEEFSGRTLDGTEMKQIRAKGLGSHFSISTQEHTFNLEKMHTQFTANMIEKKHMDGVVAVGDALTSYYKSKLEVTRGAEADKYEGLYKFLDTQIVLNVLKEREYGTGQFSKKKYNIPNPWYKKGATGLMGKEYVTFSFYKMLMGLKSLTTGKSMWLKPIGGTFNGAIVLAFNTVRGLSGTLSELAGVSSEAVDFTLGDLKSGYADVSGYYGDIIRGKKRDNKLYNIAQKFQYLPDNYDYAVDNSDMVALKNPNMRFDMLFKFHAIHEEHGHLALLSAMMRRIKMEDGTSLWDNYNSDGTFMETKNGKPNIRGIQKLPTGETRVIAGLTTEELSRMLKISTTIHGAYRSDEKSVMEAHAVGQFFLQFKKYLPALLIQEWQSKQDDVFLGHFKNTTKEGNMKRESVEIIRKTIDNNGNPIETKEVVEADVMEWHSEQHKGRALAMLEIIKGLPTWTMMSRYENLSEREKAGIIGVMSRGIMYSFMWLLVHAMFDDEDFEEDKLAIRFNYLTNDMLQGFNPAEVARTIKNPFASITHINNIFDSSRMFFMSGLTGERTRDGKLKGQTTLSKNLPFLSVKHELDMYGVIN